MRKLIITTFTAIAAFAALPAHADMATAQQAYAEGRFLDALEDWRAEANRGSADAAWYAGNLYVDGLGLDEPSPEMAAAMYQLAVDQDHTEAKVSLGLLYAQGRGVDQDYVRAMGLLYEAGVAGHPVAQVELGNYFLDGVPDQVIQSEGHAFEWYGLAALRGVVLAQMRYGQMNFYGRGAPVNMEAGLMWLSIAREIAQGEEPYWSYRTYPLDAPIGVGEDTLRTALDDVYDDMVLEAPPELVDTAQQAALAWLAEREAE